MREMAGKIGKDGKLGKWQHLSPFCNIEHKSAMGATKKIKKDH